MDHLELRNLLEAAAVDEAPTLSILDGDEAADTTDAEIRVPIAHREAA